MFSVARLRCSAPWFGAICLSFSVTLLSAGDSDPALNLRLRSRVETAPKSGKFNTITRAEQWDARQTAVIVCDMWDLHHCLNAVRRGSEMAPRMNELLIAMRDRGATIIHAPSGCMAFYEGHAARERAKQTPRAEQLPAEIGQWCTQIPAEEQGEYPIDQSDGGEDDDLAEHGQWADKLTNMGRDPKAPWIRQTELLEIKEEQDYISDDGAEIWSILAQRGIDKVMLLGVHTNMCVLGRPFGLRNMARYGKHVVLVRDMTDTMYNPERSPFVSHFTGTDLIVAHVEKWVCPSITSDQILGGTTFRFSLDKRPHIAIVLAEPEYKTDETLPRFATEQLGKNFKVSLVYGSNDQKDLPGLEVLDEADVALISVRRRPLPTEELETIRRFVTSGKSVVGIRTASHAFSLRGQAPPDGLQTWESWDHDVFGGNYQNHYGSGTKTKVSVAKGADEHPILRDVDVSQLVGNGSLYAVSPLESTTTSLLIGEVPEKPSEPIAYVNTTKFGGVAFYTSLGQIEDFAEPAFQKLLTNALAWAAEKSQQKH